MPYFSHLCRPLERRISLYFVEREEFSADSEGRQFAYRSHYVLAFVFYSIFFLNRIKTMRIISASIKYTVFLYYSLEISRKTYSSFSIFKTAEYFIHRVKFTNESSCGKHSSVRVRYIVNIYCSHLNVLEGCFRKYYLEISHVGWLVGCFRSPPCPPGIDENRFVCSSLRRNLFQRII